MISVIVYIKLRKGNNGLTNDVGHFLTYKCEKESMILNISWKNHVSNFFSGNGQNNAPVQLNVPYPSQKISSGLAELIDHSKTQYE